MEFALFYEIPVARPWDERSEHRAYQNTIEQAVLADKLGWHGFWSVEHHFLEEYSHCSNPEVLYGAIAARTENLKIGYGVRLLPKPYNHPVRSAESAAVLDLISNGRVEFGTGRSSTRPELEGFGIDPAETREQWEEAIEHIVGCWTNDEYEFEGKHWSMPKRAVLPKPYQKPHPPLWGATASADGHKMMGEMGIGLLSFSVGTPPSDLARRVSIYREGLANCKNPVGKAINPRAACFTMVNCAPTDEESWEVSRESFEWYPAKAGALIASLPAWMAERNQELGTYDYLGGGGRRGTQEAPAEGPAPAAQPERPASMFDYLRDSQACVVGNPDSVIEACKAYEATGADLLLCLVNPYNIPHDKVMQTIELMGKHVLPAFS